ncbi:MAG: hypothetical protein H6661_07425 [Ardenticatenaceae bacterium]|nr:hypothetical protein [Ardenticatenaceae bacterium]
MALAALLAARRWLKQEKKKGRYVLHHPTGSLLSSDIDFTPLRRQIEQAYNLTTCGCSPLRWHPLRQHGWETLERKVQSLLETRQKQNRLPDLLRQPQADRPLVTQGSR